MFVNIDIYHTSLHMHITIYIYMCIYICVYVYVYTSYTYMTCHDMV